MIEIIERHPINLMGKFYDFYIQQIVPRHRADSRIRWRIFRTYNILLIHMIAEKELIVLDFK